jgi:intracellular sulfur oxidation DsrE/DsrF family protein
MMTYLLKENVMINYSISVFRLLLLAIALSWAAQPVFAQGDVVAADSSPRVVYHADFADPRRFSAMLTSINNMVTYYNNELIDYDVRIVFISHGIRFLTDDKLENTPFAADATLEERRSNLRGRLATLNKVHGVKLELCNITRTEIGLHEDALYEGVELVPSGVVRLAELQAGGFAYIKIE